MTPRSEGTRNIRIDFLNASQYAVVGSLARRIVAQLAFGVVWRTQHRYPAGIFGRYRRCDFSPASGARLTPSRAGIGLDSTKSTVFAPCEVHCRAAQAALDGLPPVSSTL